MVMVLCESEVVTWLSIYMRKFETLEQNDKIRSNVPFQNHHTSFQILTNLPFSNEIRILICGEKHIVCVCVYLYISI